MSLRLLDDVVKKNIRSRYLVGMYKEKISVGISLSEQEKSDLVFQCAICNSTAEIIYLLFTQLIDNVPFDKLPQTCIDMLNTCLVGYEISNKKSISREEIFNDPTYKENNFGQRDYDFGKIDLNDIRKFLDVSDNVHFMGYDNYCEQTYNFLLGCARSNVLDTLSPIIMSYLRLPEDERVSDLNILFACWHLHKADNPRKAIIDRKYSELKYPGDDFSSTHDYKSLLASVGIELEPMSKNFISEISHVYSNEHSGPARN